jgi:hypothetical protein
LAAFKIGTIQNFDSTVKSRCGTRFNHEGHGAAPPQPKI